MINRQGDGAACSISCIAAGSALSQSIQQFRQGGGGRGSARTSGTGSSSLGAFVFGILARALEGSSSESIIAAPVTMTTFRDATNNYFRHQQHLRALNSPPHQDVQLTICQTAFPPEKMTETSFNCHRRSSSNICECVHWMLGSPEAVGARGVSNRVAAAVGRAAAAGPPSRHS